MTTKFVPGRSGNPKGRPKGIVDKRAQLRSLIEPALPDLLAKLVDVARNGDVAALRLLLDRTMPTLRSVAEPSSFELDTSLPAPQAARSVIAAMASGQITPELGKALLSGLELEKRLTTLEDFEARIAVLEASLPGASS